MIASFRGVHNQLYIKPWSFKEYGTNYNWEHSKGGSVYELLDIDINILDDSVFHIYQTREICKFLEGKGTEHCNVFLTPTKVEAPFGIYDNGFKAKTYWSNSYYSVIGMMLYPE